MWKEASVHSLRLRMLFQVRGFNIFLLLFWEVQASIFQDIIPPTPSMWLIKKTKLDGVREVSTSCYNHTSQRQHGKFSFIRIRTALTCYAHFRSLEFWKCTCTDARYDHSKLDAQQISRWRRPSAVTLPGTSNQLFAASFILLSVYSLPQSYFPLLFIHSLSASIIIIIAFRMFVSWLGERQCFHC